MRRRALLVVVVVLLVCFRVPAQAETIDLNQYYKFPLSVGVGYESLTALAAFNTPYTIFDVAGVLTYPIPSIPVLQPFLRLGFARFDSIDRNISRQVGPLPPLRIAGALLCEQVREELRGRRRAQRGILRGHLPECRRHRSRWFALPPARPRRENQPDPVVQLLDQLRPLPALPARPEPARHVQRIPAVFRRLGQLPLRGGPRLRPRDHPQPALRRGCHPRRVQRHAGLLCEKPCRQRHAGQHGTPGSDRGGGFLLPARLHGLPHGFCVNPATGAGRERLCPTCSPCSTTRSSAGRARSLSRARSSPPTRRQAGQPSSASP